MSQFSKRKPFSLRNIFLASTIGLSLGASGYCIFAPSYRAHEAAPADAFAADAAPAAVPEPESFVDQQTVYTFFEKANSRADGPTPNELFHLREKFHTRTVAGHFPASEAYRVDVVHMDYSDRDRNVLVSSTLSSPVTNGTYPDQLANVFSNPKVTPLSQLAPGERDRLRDIYVSMGYDNSEGRGQGRGVPAGLADPSVYLKPGVDGYSFQYWIDALNGGYPGARFRDVTGAYDDDGKRIPGKKIVTEAVINSDGRVCRIKGDTIDKNDNDLFYTKRPPMTCQRVDDMSPKQLQALKTRAAAVGMPLIDETFHTFVRDAKGKILAKDVTKTLALSPYDLVVRWDGKEYQRETTTGPVDTYEVLDLDAAGKRVAKIYSVSFPKGTLPDDYTPVFGQKQERVKSPEHSYEEEVTVYTIAGKDAGCETDPLGYDIRFIDDTFRAHGKNSRLPRNQRNKYGA